MLSSVTDMMDSLDQVREITCPRKREAGPIYDAFVWLVAFWAHARWAAPSGRLTDFSFSSILREQ